ncbi:hypothetical protein [Sphingomonas suaedae]|uniref:hypothetical protein n=1 Tax=Sphingomonas suaedae TaxID=2599297 RepID=UPI001644674E|nr:hypothetical protein [Sphingomonas suaedae]
MDLNYLLYRHQVSLMRAEAADCLCARRSHRDLARGYAQRIGALRAAHGADTMLMSAAF